MKKITLLIILLLNLVFIQNSAFSQEQDIYSIAYMNRLQNKVKANWIIPHGQEDKKTVVVFDVDKNGNLSDSFISKSSGDKVFDEVALSAISKSAPFESMPQRTSNENVKISFVFSQNSIEATQVSGENKIYETVQKTYEISPAKTQNKDLSAQNDVKPTKHNTKKIVKNADFAPYIGELQRDIKSNWAPPKFSMHKVAVASFTVDKSGEISDLKIYKSSGNKNFDKKALEAVSQTAPFAPLPEDFDASSVDIKFTFNYNLNRSNPEITNLMFNNYYFVPSNFSSPVTKMWAVDKVIWWAYLVAKICSPSI